MSLNSRLPIEIEDEELLSPNVKRTARVIGVFALILLIATSVAIWAVDYRKNSKFDALKGEITHSSTETGQ